MGDVVNLRLARKAKRRDTAEVAAIANRRLHGRTKAEVQAERAAAERRDATLDGAKLERQEGR